jgi:putative hydrolase of HD superfamily
MFEFAEDGASARLLAQLRFVGEVDRLKEVLRRTALIGGARRENSAEHSWHVALAAVVLAEYARETLDVAHVVKMLLVHDVVEIDAGDTFAYDLVGKASQAAREAAAAHHLFGLLPLEQGDALRALWEEFEACTTAEAKFANAMDRLLPALQNYANGGGTWRDAQVNQPRVVERLQPIDEGAPALWEFVEGLLADATARGWIAPGP